MSLVERPLLDWVKRAPVDESALSAVRATRGTRSLSIGLRNGQVIATDEGGEEVIDERSVRRWIEAINASASPPVLAKPEGPALAQLGLEYATGASTTLYMHRMPFGMALFRDREGIAYPLVPGGAEKVVPSASYFAGRVLVDRDLYAIHRIETEIKQQLYRIERGVVVGDWLSTQTRVDPSWPGELARELSYLQGLETERRPKQAPARKLVLHFEEPPIPDPKAATRIELELYGNSSRCSAGKRGASDVWRLNAKTCAILLGDWSSPRP